MPRASISLPLASRARPGSTFVITPSLTNTSASRGPVGVYTVPLRRSSSVKFQVFNPEQRRVRDAGLTDVVLTALAPIDQHHQVDHIEAAVTQHLDRTE